MFNLSGSAWDTRADDDDPRVPLLAISGRLGVVNAKSANTQAAFQLLLWLSDDRMSPQISAASPATTLFRQSNLKSPGQWVEKPVSALAAVQYGDATEAALRHEQWLGALRMPGRAEYLAALDEAVAAAVRARKPRWMPFCKPTRNGVKSPPVSASTVNAPPIGTVLGLE